MQVGHGTTPHTANPQPIVLDLGNRFPSLTNYRLVVIDTPGFDSYTGDSVILQRIANLLAAS